MVAVAERWAAFRDESPSLFRWIFGIFFGFGLLKWRATAVLAGYIASGMIGVEIAQSKHMLVEAMVVTAPAFTHPFQGGETRVFISAPLGLETVPDILCTDTASGLLVDALYAMDMIIPAFQLHQEAKCEIKPGLESDTTGWLVARAIYSVVGWLVVALSLGTLSGLLGRVVGGGEA